jgi:hypothetical protein
VTEPEHREPEPEGSWLDEVSLSTKIVFVVTIASVVVLGVLWLADLFF